MFDACACSKFASPVAGEGSSPSRQGGRGGKHFLVLHCIYKDDMDSRTAYICPADDIGSLHILHVYVFLCSFLFPPVFLCLHSVVLDTFGCV